MKEKKDNKGRNNINKKDHQLKTAAVEDRDEKDNLADKNYTNKKEV